LRGHGLSSAAPRYSFAGFLGDLSAVMEAVRIFDPAPVLVGYSLGADPRGGRPAADSLGPAVRRCTPAPARVSRASVDEPAVNETVRMALRG
ncbi:alpha/beta fold hydrolase, partial [Nocardia carnea]|uniref:alpha/beta fold hydrolase n=1 Tax=Nocardia carnea TaxID=37328 RepID=UPI003D7952DF